MQRAQSGGKLNLSVFCGVSVDGFLARPNHALDFLRPAKKPQKRVDGDHAFGDHAYIVWTAETADNTYEFAIDTFVVRHGKIVAQSFAANIKPKR
jgi:hypothetical protein